MESIKIGRWSAAGEATFRAGMELVERDLSDEAVRDAIRDVAAGDSRALEEAAKHAFLWKGRDDFLSDRAKRVFYAAARNTSVARPDAAMADTFRREQALYRGSRDDAVRELWRLSGELEAVCRGIRDDARAPETGKWRALRRLRRVSAALERVVGPEARDAADPLLLSPIAAQLITAWIWDVCGFGDTLG